MSRYRLSQYCLICSKRCCLRSSDRPEGIISEGRPLWSMEVLGLIIFTSVSSEFANSRTKTMPGWPLSNLVRSYMRYIVIEWRQGNRPNYSNEMVLTTVHFQWCMLCSVHQLLKFQQLQFQPEMTTLYVDTSSLLIRKNGQDWTWYDIKFNSQASFRPKQTLQARYDIIMLFLFCPTQLSAWRQIFFVLCEKYCK